MGVHHQTHRFARELIGHLKAFGQVRYCAVLSDKAGDAVIKQCIEPGGLGAQTADAGQITLVALQGSQAIQTAMDRLVINLLDPGPQSGIEVIQTGDQALIEFTEELIPKGAMPALQFALALRRIRTTKDQVDAQTGAHALQGSSSVGGAIVDNEFDWHAPAQQRLFEHAFNVQSGLAQAKRTVGHQARGIIEQGHQVGLAQLALDGNMRAMHHVAVPNRTGKLGAEAALLLGQA